MATGLCPDPLGELKRSPDPLAAIRGSTSKGREREGRGGKGGEEEWRGGGRKGRGKGGRRGRGGDLLQGVRGIDAPGRDCGELVKRATFDGPCRPLAGSHWSCGGYKLIPLRLRFDGRSTAYRRSLRS